MIKHTQTFMYHVHFFYQIINKWNMLIIFVKSTHTVYVMQHFSSSSLQISTKIKLWDVGLMTSLYFQQYLSQRRDGSHFLKISTWISTFFRALRHSSVRMLQNIHESWNLASCWCANRLACLPSGHQCLHIQSYICTNSKYNQMQGDGITVPHA
jgi:hypothetical protein